MKCSIHFFLLNEHFSQGYADSHNQGEESELNSKYLWEDEMEVKDIRDILVHDKSNYQLKGSTLENGAFSYGVPKMKMFELVPENQVSTFVGCSESVHESFNIEKTKETIVLKVYLKADEPFANPISGIYIATKEFPKELVF